MGSVGLARLRPDISLTPGEHPEDDPASEFQPLSADVNEFRLTLDGEIDKDCERFDDIIPDDVMFEWLNVVTVEAVSQPLSEPAIDPEMTSELEFVRRAGDRTEPSWRLGEN